MSGSGAELVRRAPSLPDRLPDDLTVDEMRAFLVGFLDAHPELDKGVVLEVWPDGRMTGSLGGRGMAPRGIVITVEHAENREPRYYR